MIFTGTQAPSRQTIPLPSAYKYWHKIFSTGTASSNPLLTLFQYPPRMRLYTLLLASTILSGVLAFESTHPLAARQCVDCPDIPICTCASGESCILIQRSCFVCPQIQCIAGSASQTATNTGIGHASLTSTSQTGSTPATSHSDSPSSSATTSSPASSTVTSGGSSSSSPSSAPSAGSAFRLRSAPGLASAMAIVGVGVGLFRLV
ncbi:hypothetical protein C8F01DRAFT_100573 [Mycena amicta]|nr:hypothetical protein C8F01DRAFT_100573 [Mycena amicta]